MKADESEKWMLKRLRVRSDARGSLVAIEAEQEAPFGIERVYYLYGTPNGAERGFHAHRKLQQLAVAVSGSCTFMLDDGRERGEVRLDGPDVGLYIGAMVWREMREFSPDCIVLVLASERFDERDYIRDYGEFQLHVHGSGAQ